MQSNVGLAECLAEVSCLREVVKKLAASVGMDLPAEVGSGGVHVTGKEGGTPCRQAGDDACLAGASRADASSAQLKSEREPGSVVVPGMYLSKDKATPHRDAGHGNKHVLSNAGDSAALIPTQGTNSPRGTRNGLDLPVEREYPPDGTHSGLVSSPVSRWE